MPGRFSLKDIFSKAGEEFKSSRVSNKELESMLRDVVKKEYPDKTVKKFEITENGVKITLDDNEIINIDVDWQEIILS